MTGTDALLAEAAEQFGTPAYVYFTDVIDAQLRELRAAFGRWFTISYAMKSNPNPALLRRLAGQVDWLDVSSGGELALACKSGWTAERISFTGPGKRRVEIETAICDGVGELVIENVREARIANDAAARLGRTQHILVRLSPSRVPKGFGDQMAGRPSPFGIDIENAAEELTEIAALPNLSLVGLHIYSGTQCLKPSAICENWRIFMQAFRDMCDSLDLAPRKLIFGSGLGIPYHQEDKALDLALVASEIGPELEEFRIDPRFKGTELVLELGRYLVGEAGYFLTRVTTVKESRGTRIAICDGGLSHNLAASGNFGMVLRRNYVMHRVGGDEGGSRQTEKVDITGPLCTSIDKLGGGVSLPRVEKDDLIAIHACGAYGPTASPLYFISHPLPREIVVVGSNLADVTRIRGEAA